MLLSNIIIDLTTEDIHNCRNIQYNIGTLESDIKVAIDISGIGLPSGSFRHIYTMMGDKKRILYYVSFILS